MAIECKRLSSAVPLVVSRVPREDNESYHQVLAANIGNVNSTRVVQPTDRPSMFYRPGEYVGKKTSQIGVEEEKDGTRVWDSPFSSMACVCPITQVGRRYSRGRCLSDRLTRLRCTVTSSAPSEPCG